MARPKPGNTSKKDKIIEVMFDALPATTMEEIVEKIRRKMPEIEDWDVPRALSHLRKNTEKYGWTIPHVGGNATKENRYFALLVERDGSYYFDKSPESMAHLHDGSRSIVSRIATESGNQASMLLIAAKHTRKRNRRFEINNL